MSYQNVKIGFIKETAIKSPQVQWFALVERISNKSKYQTDDCINQKKDKCLWVYVDKCGSFPL